MPSGIPNDAKSKVRQLYAEGKASREELLEAEAASYHAPGTCTFYGTANSNQMLMELMGLHLPGASFVAPNSSLREALTVAAVERVAAITALGHEYTPIGRIVDERAIVNGIAGLHATGGSTNLLLHIVAIARAAGIIVTLEDFDAIASAVPLLARVYPNGKADVNQFHAAGGLNFLIAQLLDAGLAHADVNTVNGTGLDGYRKHALLDAEKKLSYVPVAAASHDETVLRPASSPFRPDGGLKALDGNLGRAVIKISAVAPERAVIEAPAIVFDEQDDVKAAFERGELDRDFIAVVRFQGPRANGMPELHKLTPTLGVLQDRGFKVALVTDGRMSGASGKVPAAIHLTPEAASGGAIAKIRNGDIVRLDANAGTLEVKLDAHEFNSRALASATNLASHHVGLGRELFSLFRDTVGASDAGASVFGN